MNISKGLSFVLGIVTGILLTIIFAVIVSSTKQTKQHDGVTMLDEPIPFADTRSFKVLQVISDDAALASSGEQRQYSSYIHYSDPYVLIVSDQKNTFYDNQIVNVPYNCNVMQVGTYNYNSQMGPRTVPIIRFVRTQ